MIQQLIGFVFKSDVLYLHLNAVQKGLVDQNFFD